jgi:hypothetical protein
MRVDQQGIVTSTHSSGGAYLCGLCHSVVRRSSLHSKTAAKAGMPRTRCKTLEVIYVYSDYLFPTH